MDKKQLSILASFNLSFHWFSVGIIAPIMSLFLLEKGLNLYQIGIVFACYSLTTVILELPTGGLADAIGRKKVYLISLMFLVLSLLIIILLEGFSALIVCSVFQGIARSLSSGSMDAHFIDEFYKIDKNINIQKEMAKIGIFIPLALGLGSLLGGFIPMTLGQITKYSFLKNEYSGNYIVVIIALMLQFAMTVIFVKEDKKDNKETSIVKGIKQVPQVIGTSVYYGIKHPVVLLILIAGLAWGFSISSLEQLWQPQVKNILGGQSQSWIFGLLMAGYFLSASLGSLIATPICKLFKNNYSFVLFLSRSLMGVFYFVLAMRVRLLPFTFFYFMMFFFNGIQISPESSLFNDAIPSDKRSTLLSLSSLFLQLGGIIGSVFLGYVAESFSISTAWYIASVVIGVSALLYLFIPFFKDKKNRDQSTTIG